MAVKKTGTEILEIRPIEVEKVGLRIVGTTPLIMHAWSDKAMKLILDAQQGKIKGKGKEAKVPVEDFIKSMYWLTPPPKEMTEEAFDAAIAAGARFGFPATAFKQAAISAAYRMGWTKDKMSARGAFFIDADEAGLVEIHSDKPVMREDMVRIAMGTADIRYRGEFRNWYADLVISYNTNSNFDLENIINMLNAGGYVCGVGEWRPERDGQYGMFTVAASCEK